MSEHDRYADWDGAYVLGALSPGERADYEHHLTTCLTCQDAVAELAPLPGLLAHVDADSLDGVDELPPADLERRLMAAAGATDASVVPLWRRTSTRVGLALAAAAAVAAAIVLPHTLAHHPAAGSVQLSLHSATGKAMPLSAHVALAPEDWGTELRMTCRYAGSGDGSGSGYGSRAYALYVVDDDGRPERVSTWRSGPGQTARTVGSTELDLGEITEVEVRDVATDAVLLSSSAVTD